MHLLHVLSALRLLNETRVERGEEEECSLLALARSEWERVDEKCWPSTMPFYFVGSGSTDD